MNPTTTNKIKKIVGLKQCPVNDPNVIKLKSICEHNSNLRVTLGMFYLMLKHGFQLKTSEGQLRAKVATPELTADLIRHMLSYLLPDGDIGQVQTEMSKLTGSVDRLIAARAKQLDSRQVQPVQALVQSIVRYRRLWHVYSVVKNSAKESRTTVSPLRQHHSDPKTSRSP